MAIILYHGEKLPTLPSKKGAFVLLNGVDAMGDYDTISNKEFNECRQAYFDSLTFDDLKGMCDDVLVKKRNDIHNELEKLLAKRKPQSGLPTFFGDMKLLLWLRKKKQSNKPNYDDNFAFGMSELQNYSEEDIAEGRKIIAEMDKEINLQVDSLNAEVEKYIENDVWTAAQLVGIDTNEFSFKMTEQTEIKSMPGLIKLGKNYMYALLILKKLKIL